MSSPETMALAAIPLLSDLERAEVAAAFAKDLPRASNLLAAELSSRKRISAHELAALTLRIARRIAREPGGAS